MFKKDLVKRLNVLKESKVESLINVCKPFTVNCLDGYMLVTPFGSHDYSFDVIMTDKEKFDTFLKAFEKKDIVDYISDSNVIVDDVIKFYKIGGFINKALLEDLKLIIKELLNDKH